MNKKTTYVSKDKINRDFLIGFYKEVWLKFEHYVNNDKVLYELFKKDHDDKEFILHARICALSSMYAAAIDNIPHMLETIKNCNNKLVHDEILTRYADDGKNYNLISFISKYCHWYNEVNHVEESTPIYDVNVRNALKHYGCEKIKNYEGLKDGTKKFIQEIGGVSFNTIIPLSIDGLHTELSIYRIVDKFLWLSYKVDKLNKRKAGLKKNEKYLLEISQRSNNSHYFGIL